MGALLPWWPFGVAIVAVGLILLWLDRRGGFGTSGRPAIVQPRGPAAPGPISIRGLKIKMRLVYARGPKRYARRVTVYAATGHRRADGRLTLELLHTFCHLRHAPRTFRVDRIITAADDNSIVIRDLTAWVLAAVAGP
jgi:hypothetical protein